MKGRTRNNVKSILGKVYSYKKGVRYSSLKSKYIKLTSRRIKCEERSHERADERKIKSTQL